MANATSVILAVNQQKGGTGKTTTTASLGDALQRFLSKRVLLVDLDRQASLTDWLVDPFGQGIAADMAGIEDLLDRRRDRRGVGDPDLARRAGHPARDERSRRGRQGAREQTRGAREGADQNAGAAA